jgi:hypothetical protein
VSISFAALIDRKYGKPREPKFKISAEGDRDEFENGL